MSATKTVRVATVKATGARFLVERVSFSRNEKQDPSKAYCWGELRSFKGLASVHEPIRSFLLSAVDVKDVAKTPELLRALFEQGIAAKRAAGHVVSRTRGGNAVDHGTPADIEARRAANEAFAPAIRALRDGDLAAFSNALLFSSDR